MEAALALIGLLFSFIFAGSESAFTRFNKVRLEIWYRRKIPLSKNAFYFVNHPDRFFSTILIGNNLANTLCTTFATLFFIRYMSESVMLLLTGFLILLLGEIIPKSLFRSAADQIILYVLIFVRGFYTLLAPLIKIINICVEFILRLLHVQHETMSTYFSREEFELLLGDQSSPANKRFDQYDYINNVLSFSSAQIKEVMTPRTDIVSISINSQIDKALQAMHDSNESFIIIFDNDLDDIAGVVFLYDFFTGKTSLPDFIKPLSIVPENKSCIDTFSEFQKNNISVALVVDEYGGTAGVVTMDDLVEEVVGEFLEPLEMPYSMQKINKNTWLADAQININDVQRNVGIKIPEGDYETVAGFILEQTGKIPFADETLEYTDFKIKIMETTRQRINKIQIIKKKN